LAGRLQRARAGRDRQCWVSARGGSEVPHANPTRSELTAFHATTPRGLLGRGRVETRRGQNRDTCFPMPRRPRSPTRAATACSAPAPFRAERIWRVLKAIWRSAAEDVRAYTPHAGRRCLTGAMGTGMGLRLLARLAMVRVDFRESSGDRVARRACRAWREAEDVSGDDRRWGPIRC
jgi:hypothetical protein